MVPLLKANLLEHFKNGPLFRATIGLSFSLNLESGIQMTVEKPKPKQLLRPITTGTNSAMNESEFLAIICNLPGAQEKSRVQGAIGFGFASRWLKNWREIFKPVTKRSNCNRIVTFDGHLKTALIACDCYNSAES